MQKMVVVDIRHRKKEESSFLQVRKEVGEIGRSRGRLWGCVAAMNSS